jgi:hypothetical protein
MLVKLVLGLALVFVGSEQVLAQSEEEYFYGFDEGWSDEDSGSAEVHPLSDDMISQINRVQKNWTVSNK